MTIITNGPVITGHQPSPTISNSNKCAQEFNSYNNLRSNKKRRLSIYNIMTSGRTQLVCSPPTPSTGPQWSPIPYTGPQWPPTPSTGPQRHPTPSIGPQRPPTPSTGPQRPPTPSTGLQQPPTPYKGPQRPPTPSTGPQRPPTPSTGPQQPLTPYKGPQRPPTHYTGPQRPTTPLYRSPAASHTLYRLPLQTPASWDKGRATLSATTSPATVYNNFARDSKDWYFGRAKYFTTLTILQKFYKYSNI